MATRMERVTHGCLVHRAHGDGTIGSAPQVTCLEQYAYEESASLILYRVPDVMTTLAFRGGSPPNARVWHTDSSCSEEVEMHWTPVIGTSWWRCDGQWMFPVVTLDGGQSGTVLRIGVCLHPSDRDAVYFGASLATIPTTHPLYDTHQASRVVITLPSTSNDDNDVEVHEDALCDTVSWCTDMHPTACLKFAGYPRLYITPVLSEAVTCGIVGSYDNDTCTASVWLGQMDIARLPSMTWSFGSFF